MSDTAIRYLVGSDNRRRVLAALRADGPLTRRDLEDRIAASRRTVKRTLGELEDRGWIRPVGEGYDATALGVSVLDALDGALDRVDLATRFAPLLSHVPGDAVDLDVGGLADATLVSPTEGNPYAAMHRLHELRTGAAYVRELAPTPCLDGVEQLTERIGSADDPPDVEAVVEAAALDAVDSSSDVRAELEALATAETADVRTCDQAIPVVLGVYDETAVIGALDDDGILVALAETTDPAVRDWVVDEYRSYRQQSTPFDA
ncbi:helix-turn-helix transcriptional regulator [Haloplanus sp. GCM10025708]|uniref:helix-turn-helix transcriptional regulator n=1 Tax=Haloferacaceae TaxID=1644056 RepID=UPI003614201B